MDASDIHPRRINAKEVLIRQKDDEIMFPFADGTAKLSGRDYEFREPTEKREPTVRSEDFSRELHGEPSRAKDNPASRKVVAKLVSGSEMSSKTVYCCKVESPESTRQRAESSQSKNQEDHIASKRRNFDDPLPFGSQVYPAVTSDKNSGCTRQRMKKARDNSSMDFGKIQEQKGGYS